MLGAGSVVRPVSFSPGRVLTTQHKGLRTVGFQPALVSGPATLYEELVAAAETLPGVGTFLAPEERPFSAPSREAPVDGNSTLASSAARL